MSTAILKNAPAGNVGDISRLQNTVVEPIMQGSQFTGFGLPGKFDGAGKLIPFGGGAETAASFAGIISRMVPSISGSVAEGFGDGVPNLDSVQGLVKKGYCLVKCSVGTPVRGGAVYVRIVAASGKLIGDFEASADSTNSILLTNVSWASNGKDAAGTAELSIGL